jgi:hypothetical protein
MKKYKWCIHCKEFHQICYRIWEFRKNSEGIRTPYRCKIARRKRYNGKEKERMAKYYANMAPNKKLFVNERKRLRKQFNNGTITEAEFNKLITDSYEKHLGGLNEKTDGVKGSGESVPDSKRKPR